MTTSGRAGIAVQIVFETHSTSTDNEARIASGWRPGQLSELGRSQAVELGARRRDDNIDVVFCSDLRRAVETAEIAFAGTSMTIFQDACLRECNYGDFNGMHVERLHAERSSRVDSPFPGGESYRDCVARVAAFLRDVSRDRDGQRILAIGHSATRWALDCLLDGKRLEDIIDAPFNWQEGWEYVLPDDWIG